ncbi:hypothetical protein ABBQ32_013958 [Trebouxia sp. C0010 RCD-2024]
MADFNPDVEFLGFKVPAGKSFSLSDLVPVDDMGVAHRPHITNVALGPDPKPGRHTVFAQGNGTKAVVGTLEMGRCEQFQIDLVACDLIFSHTGKSDIYLTGYNTTSTPYFEGMSDEDDDEDSEDDEEAPAGVPLLRKSQLMSSKEAAAKQQSLLEDEASSSGGDEEDDDEEDDEEDDSDEDEDEAARKQKGIAYLKQTLTAQPLNGNADSDEDNDDDEDAEDSDMEDDEDDNDDDDGDILARMGGVAGSSEEESDSEDEPVAAQLPKAVPGKRAAPSKPSPQPSKKAKAAPGSGPAAAAKAQTAAAAPHSGVSGPAAAQWQTALKSYLVQSGGQTDMSKLGGVKKPEGIPKGQKLKAFLQQHPDVFTLDGNSVALKEK